MRMTIMKANKLKKKSINKIITCETGILFLSDWLNHRHGHRNVETYFIIISKSRLYPCDGKKNGPLNHVLRFYRDEYCLPNDRR